MTDDLLTTWELEDECASCGEGVDDVCSASKRACGHHCNHIWTHDHCDWCEKDFGEEAVTVDG